jgi:hypothetical protein
MRGSFSTMTESVEYRWSFLAHKAVATANPAFRKAGISIGTCSDARLNPKLDCSYFSIYEQLSSFLVRLRKNNYLFSNELLETRA